MADESDMGRLSRDGRSFSMNGGSPRAPMNTQRLLRLRLRVATGFYSRPSVLRAAARRILESGDVEPHV